MISMEKLKMLSRECWWGGKAPDGCDMPYSEARNTVVNIRERKHENDQSASMFLSSCGRYIWNDNPFTAEFKDGEIILTDENGSPFDIQEGYGTLRGAYLAAMKNHFPFSGDLPDKLFFTTPQYNTWMALGTKQTTENILEYAREIINDGFPTGILMIDGGWQEDYGVFEFHKGKVPDPGALIYELHKMGFKVMLWTSPIVSGAGDRFKELHAKGYFIKGKDGEVAIRKWWSGYSPMIDFTNPEAIEWMYAQLDNLMERYGVDGYKFDAGDASFYADDDIIYKPMPARNHTTAFNLMGEKYKLNEFRAAHNSGGRPIVARLHDKFHTWDSMGLNTLIPNTTVQSLLGYAYSCPDMVGGGTYGSIDGIDEELFIRWTQANALMPMMQISLLPSRILSPKSYEIVKEYIMLHKKFGDYIYDLAKESAKCGEPIFRCMEYQFPGEGFERVCDQYMLGDKYMAAPILEKGATRRNVKFPSGKWCDADGTVISNGNETLTLDAPIDKLLYFENMSL